MKKLTTLLIVFILLFSTSTVYASDYSSMSDSELNELYNIIRNEFVNRNLKAEKKAVLIEQNGIQIYISDNPQIDKQYSWDKSSSLFIPIVVINDSDKNINVACDDASLNGWTTNISDSTDVIPAGKKAKGNLIFELEDTDIETISDFEDAEFTITVFDNDNWFGDKVVDKTKPITITVSN